MKKYKIIASLFSVAFVFAMISGCKKDFLDINENPNSPENVSIKEVLPSAQLAIAHVVGNNFQIFGGLWSQYWTQNPNSSQYKTIDQYSPSADDFDNPWKIMYADALQDLQYISKTAATDGKTQYTAIAKILQAYSYQLLTDNFGDIPFSEALRVDEGILTPKYDSQKDVYNGIINLLNEGTALINTSATNGPSTDDLFFGGDMSKWEAFANTLKLRVYMRLSEVDPVKAQTGIAALSGKTFLGAGEDVKIDYFVAGGNSNPLYSAIVELSNTQNLVASSTTIDTMTAWNDDRITVLYDSLGGGGYAGIPQGDYNSGTPTTSISAPGDVTGGNSNTAAATAPVKLMTGYESLFLQAEAAARGWLNAGTDMQLYNDAITASYTSYGLDAASAATYSAQPAVLYPTAGTQAQKIKAIITQKWLAMCGNQNIESWTEWRRTGYPDFFVESAASILGSGRLPARFYYPSTEVTRNPNTPGQKQIYDRVWWDIN